ncbi:MAG TPA: HDOD domain-containing protein [Kofleriaceae bacterium]|nr:HDOD domain-containing protein [Kofleriaceae bacterium]
MLEAILDLVRRDEVRVPPIPAVVAKLSEQLKDTDFDLREVTRMVGTDQALSAHILRCASSTLLATRGQVTSLNEAVMRVGTNGLFALSVSFCLGKDAARASPLQSLRRDVFRKAAATAEFCRRLAPRSDADPDGAFLVGLLGSFGLTVALGAIEQVLAARRIKASRPAEAWMEIARLCDEASATSVAAKWGMPKLLSDVMAARWSDEVEPHLAPYLKLLARAESLTELFYRVASPTPQEISRAVGCTDAAAAEIAAFLPAVAASVLALGAATDDVARTQSMQLALIDAPPTSLRGQVVPASIPVTVERKNGDQQIVCVGLAADGFVAHGTHPLPLNQVVKCRFLGVDEDLELVAFVATVTKDNGYKFEMKPMGLAGGHASRWQKLRHESAREFSVNEDLDLGDGAGEKPAGDAGAGDEPERGEDRAPVDPPRPAADLEFGPMQTSESEARERGDTGSGQRGYVSVHAQRSIFRRMADWFSGRDLDAD